MLLIPNILIGYFALSGTLVLCVQAQIGGLTRDVCQIVWFLLEVFFFSFYLIANVLIINRVVLITGAMAEKSVSNIFSSGALGLKAARKSPLSNATSGP